jgi:hypothetical protein
MGGFVMRKFAVVCSLAMVLSASAITPAPAAMVVTTTVPMSTGAGAVAGVAGGFIAAVAALCLYDIWLKINGVKNWDGSPKIVQVHRHR